MTDEDQELTFFQLKLRCENCFYQWIGFVGCENAVDWVTCPGCGQDVPLPKEE